MSIQLIQITLLGFTLFMVYVLYLHWKRQDITSLMFGIWLMTWLAFAGVVVFPWLLREQVNNLFGSEVVDVVIVVAFMILTYVTVENSFKMKKFEEKMEKLVRKLAEDN